MGASDQMRTYHHIILTSSDGHSHLTTQHTWGSQHRQAVVKTHGSDS